MLGRFLRSLKSHENSVPEKIYKEIVASARQPMLFSDVGVPDTPLGRFESISAHMVLYLRRAKAAGLEAEETAQAVTEEFFQDVDYALRELGIGDTSVPKRMKKLAKMFYGRAVSYTDALDNGDVSALAAALTRNIMPENDNWPGAQMMAEYMLEKGDALTGLSDEMLWSDHFAMPKTEVVQATELST